MDFYLKVRTYVLRSKELNQVTGAMLIMSSECLPLCAVLQLFLHRIFGYRGVILFTWTARLYDRDKETRENEK